MAILLPIWQNIEFINSKKGAFTKRLFFLINDLSTLCYRVCFISGLLFYRDAACPAGMARTVLNILPLPSVFF